MNIIKRDGSVALFEKAKIENAIYKAMKYGSGIVKPEIAKQIADQIESFYEIVTFEPTVTEVEALVYDALCRLGESKTAKAYEGYRAVQEFKRQTNTTDEAIMTLIRGTNKDVIEENSNKDAKIASTQRDLIAGEVSKDIARRKLIPTHIVQAHDEGVLHYHDMDYAIQPIFNCCLINLGDMLDNGTCINGTMVESPSSFPTACTIMTQIIASVASGQYGGQSVNVKHLGKYLQKSYFKYLKMLTELYGETFEKKDIEDIAHNLMMKDLKDGVQTIQYQINTISCTNGQTPFVTLFLELDENDPYLQYTSLIIEEMLKQRLKGVKNEVGVYITPAFPKLVYVLDEHNCLKGGKYDYITKLAAKCSAKRLYPDYISAKKMREAYEGNVFSPMGQQLVA